MSTLTGQQISQTYDGLLKLSDSTTGITSPFQAIEDGLGNNTNSRIGLSGITSPNLLQVYNNLLKPQFQGTGPATVGGNSPGAGIQNTNLIFTYFYDPGVLDYSAMTVNVTTITSTSDVVEAFFYDLQFVPNYGSFPCNLIMSGITLPVSSTGFQSVTLPSTLSFSGTGGGFYCLVLKYTNGGSAPSVRFGGQLFATQNQGAAQSLGIVRNNAGTAYLIANRAGSYSGLNFYWLSSQTTPQQITYSDVASRFNTTTASNVIGFMLNTII